MSKLNLAAEHFLAVVNQQLARVEKMKTGEDFVDFGKLDKLVIGVCGGDGIGPIVCGASRDMLAFLLSDEIRAGKVELRDIEGLTIENRAAQGKSIPDDVMAALKACHVILKGPTTTPQAGDPWPNIESANVSMRRALDLFANVRPVRVPELGIDWTFFRENTEGAYAVGSKGIHVTGDLSVDFTVTTTEGTERLARLAFEFARANGKKRVSIVTKANIIKATDGKFLDLCYGIAKEYPEIQTDDWIVDVMAANLLNDKRRREYSVLILPNLYGDILTDEAAELQGGIGTAGSANLGKRWSMFEAIGGSAPRMIESGRGKYAHPAAMLRATAMLLAHSGYAKKAALLERALDICMNEEKKVVVTGREGGATCAEFSRYVMDKVTEISNG